MALRSKIISITPTITLDERELEVSFVRAAGPGGQNVNKVSTAVQLRFDVMNSRTLTESVRQRVLSLAGRRATADGVVVISASRFRTQDRNRSDAIDRLVDLVRRAATVQKKRVPTRPSKSAKKNRLEAKRRRGETKSKRSIRSADWD